MLPEVGHVALALALGVAIVQGIVPILGAHYGHAGWMRVAQTTSVVQAGLVALAFTALIKSFVTSDFTVLNVVQNSHSLKPMIYKVAGAWGSHEGSLVLWVLILAVFGAAVALFADNVPLALKARTLSVQAWISIGFLSFMLFTSNPFERVANPPLDGQDLNPLLQDLGLALHPPMLYLGYVGFSIVFSFAVAALIEGRIDPAWARWVRPWTLLAWMFLTGGIALGSWWAYYELGWGGWWFWDPVENVSFMPWLLGTALLHSAIVVEKRDTFKSWTILLAILTFSLSLLGTFVVRSGLLTSVHAFATDPERGLYILALLFVSIGGSLTLYVWRAPAMEKGSLFAPISRESGLLLNNMLLAVATMTVLLGTLYPLFHEALTGSKISVGPPFFNLTFVPIMLPLVLVMGLGVFLPWKRADILGVSSRLGVAAGLSLMAALIVWYIQTGGPVLAVIALGLGFWLLLCSIQEWVTRIKLGQIPLRQSMSRLKSIPRAAHGMTLAHAGLGVCIVGFVGASAWKQELVVAAAPGDRFELASYEMTLDRIERVPGPNYVSDRATLTVLRDGLFVTTLEPEKRSFFIAETATTEAAIYSRPAGDLYVAIGDPPEEGSGSWTVRVYYEPLVGFIWLGSIMLIGGGALSLSDRRLRIGAPKRASVTVSTTAVASTT